MVISNDSCLFSRAGNSTSSNKGLMDRHVHTQVLLENKKKSEKVQSTLNQHRKKKAIEDACEWIAKIIFENGCHLTLLFQVLKTNVGSSWKVWGGFERSIGL